MKLRDKILELLTNPKNLKELYEELPMHTPPAIRGTVYKLMAKGLVKRIEGNKYVATGEFGAEETHRTFNVGVNIVYRAEHVVKRKVHKRGHAGGIYLPKEWVGREVVVLLLSEHFNTQAKKKW